MPRFFSSLVFQITAAFALLVLCSVSASLFSLRSFQHQLAYDSVVDIAGRLELTAQQLHMQAMNYKQNAPRDYDTYYRDVRLYYQDLMTDIATFDHVVDIFMSGDFRGEMDMPGEVLQPEFDPTVAEVIHALEETWGSYRTGLFEAIGDNPEEPRLEFAAAHNLSNAETLENAAHGLTESLRVWAAQEHTRIIRVSLSAIITASTLALIVLSILYFKALSPLRRTTQGFSRVANGDFGHHIEVQGATEIRDLTTQFNALSSRIDLLFQLIARLQRGNGLDEVIGFLGNEFRSLLRLDWIGVVLVNSDGATVRIEASHLDNGRERVSKQLYRLPGTLLEVCLTGGKPMHVNDMERRATENPNYQFLHSLVERGMRDSLFLPLTPQTQTPVPAVVVFATRQANSYDRSHLDFLGNIAQLVTHSFGRTVRLAEQGRLAAIGEFASGIAHEMRTPLATISLGLDYLTRQSLGDGAQKRLTLAQQEAGRIERFLDEMLLYAKPLNLNLRRIEVQQGVEQTLGDYQPLAQGLNQQIELQGTSDGQILADPDRLTQILTNLTQNACQAAPPGSVITWTVSDRPDAGTIVLTISNPGPPIPAALLPRITEPFVSTRPGGTGLGLAIVKRLVEALGGGLEIRSEEGSGTQVSLSFPRAPVEARGKRHF